MKLTKCIAILAAVVAVPSCASFNGGYDADLDRDGVVSAPELRQHQRRINAGNSDMDYEAHQFEHIDRMIGIGERIMNRVRRF